MSGYGRLLPDEPGTDTGQPGRLRVDVVARYQLP
jgi:hypothetical protein